MGARTGEQFLDRLRKTSRVVWLGNDRVDDVTAHPELAGAARTLAGVFDRQHQHAGECLIADHETGEPVSISHMIPRSIEDLKRRNRGLIRISEATVGLMGRTPDYMNVKFACFAAQHGIWAGADHGNEEGAQNLVRFQRRLTLEDLSLTHTIIQPTIDKVTDPRIVGNEVTLHKVGETATGIVVRGARILATLAPFADEIAVYPGFPIPAEAAAYALAFAIPVDTPGLIFLCRDSASTPGAHPFDRPLSSRFDEQDAFVIFDNVEVPRDRIFIDGRVDIYNRIRESGIVENLTNQTTIRALTKLEFAYGLATRLAAAINDQSPATQEMLGELLSYVEVTRSAVLLCAEHGRHVGDGVWFPDPRPLVPLRSLLAEWFPRVAEIITLIGSHNLLATPSRRQLDDAALRPLLDEFLHGANGVDAEARAALFRLAWDFVGSGLAGRNLLYERFYLTSASRNRITAHATNPDRSRSDALVDGILAAGRGGLHGLRRDQSDVPWNASAMCSAWLFCSRHLLSRRASAVRLVSGAAQTALPWRGRAGRRGAEVEAGLAQAVQRFEARDVARRARAGLGALRTGPLTKAGIREAAPDHVRSLRLGQGGGQDRRGAHGR